MEKYMEFIGKFEEISHPYIDCTVLEKLKEDYKHVINSRRVLEKIISIKILLQVLEKRGVLQYDEVSVLKYIAQQFIKNQSVEQLISKYEIWLQENYSKINNLYTFVHFGKVNHQCVAVVQKSSPVTESSSRQLKLQNFECQTQHCTSNTFRLNREKELQELIINKVGKKIGKYWADVCRNLNIEESIIEEIEIKYFNQTNRFEKMFKQALNLYFIEHNLKWENNLMQALESSRRKDLKEMVEEIFFEYKS